MGWLLNFYFGPLWNVLSFRVRGTRQATLLWALATAVEKNLPAATLLDALADDAGRHWRDRVRGLADLLDAGVPLPDALEAIPGLLPLDVLVFVRVGASSGCPAQALREAASRITRRNELAVDRAGAGLGYIVAMAFVFVTVSTLFMYWITPRFKEIFEGFGSELPPLTQHVIQASDFVVTYAYLLLPCVLVMLAGGVSFAMLLDGLHPTGYRSGGWMTRFFPRLKSPLVLRCLGLAVDARRSTEATLGEISTAHPDPACRRLLAGACAEIAAGSEPWATLCRRGLLSRRDVALLLAAQHAGNLGWALRELAASIESRLECRLRLLAEILRPAGLICIGSLIGVFVVSMFLPLVQLLHHLS